MKNKLKSSIFIAIMITGTFAFMATPFLFFAGATHIEGTIAQDTVWTLTDSPYVVVNDLTVESSVVLTIEPGVEVRFGGNFSLVVKGGLSAKGTAEKPIKFTSNKLQPEPGDWSTIKFTSLQLSYVENCDVEYAVNGITIENGGVLVTRSEIRHNLQNGVYVTGNNNANIIENRIESNLNGISINGDASSITIERNHIHSNNETGIYFYADEFAQIDNTLILNNSISTNPVGICIYGRVSTDMTKNSIAYNDLGISYSNATNVMPLHYNDLYGNTVSARALSSDPVNAEHNYWGDASGPYHISLNPLGKGNPVESNGTDMDFIPFLTVNNSYVNQRPTARLVTNKQVVAVDDEVTFVATLSEDDRQVYRYLFNFGDGSNSGWTTLSIFKHKYSFEGNYIAILTVMDDFGVTSTNTAVVVINAANLAPLNVDLEIGKYTVKYGEDVSITVRVTDGINSINSATVTLISVKGGSFQQTTGITDSTGYFITTFTAPSIPQITDIGIIATASKDGCADGSNHKYLRVLPPLWVQITTEPETIRSEDTVKVTIRVTYDRLPVSKAEVLASFDVGGNVTKTGITDENGYSTFDFKAPRTLVPLGVTIKASATKSEYISGEGQMQKIVEPRILIVSIITEPDFIGSGETSLITATVTSSGEAISDVTVTLSSDSGGKLGPEAKTTGENGSATFAFVAFGTTTQRIATITARAEKAGYISGEVQTVITIEPRTSDVHIVEDSVWTLTDSPFVIVRDIIVEANATLTIEPGVEVRFGGNFSLVVEGGLSAKGTAEKPIKFTSNKLQPEPGDWSTIKFTNRETSTLEYCIVEYATNGITVENGNLRVESTTISNNLESGVLVAYENSVSLKGNYIAFNQIGVSILGNASGVLMEQNRIFFNSKYGINLQADMTAPILDVLILNNSLATNPVGIYVSSRVNANITRNSISYNEIGILYENARNLIPPQYNDIYDNNNAMNALTSEPINAERNYWGDVSGPYHASLNPSGKGNPVGGNGIEIVFIPFLTANNNRINLPPLASLMADKALVLTNQTITFIATNSSDDGRVYWYFFDFGDGKNSGWTTTSIFMHKYGSTGTYEAKLRVMDDFGSLNNNTAKVTILVRDDLPSLQVDLTSSAYNVAYEEQTSLLIHVTDGTSTIENASVTLIAVKDGTFLPSFGYTNATGFFTAIFTTPNVTQITNIRIIATASKEGYADNSDFRYIRVLPPFLVQMAVGSDALKSEETTNIAIHVTYCGQPVSDADVILSFNIGGSFSTTSGITDTNGFATFFFTAPQTSIPLNVTITATAMKSGYIEGEKQTQIRVEPKTFDINIIAQPNALTSEEVATITVYVTHNGTPAENANVTMALDMAGEFLSITGNTDPLGNVTFVFTAPAVSEEKSIVIVVTATKLGYAVCNGSTTVSVGPGELTALVIVDSFEIAPEKNSSITVYVKQNEKPISNAIVSVTAEAGVFSEVTGLTNSSGYCSFLFTAPKTTAERTITIVANATKFGYISDEGQATIRVTPEEVGWWSITTILLIVVPIVITAIVAILIKLKIIVLSFREEE